MYDQCSLCSNTLLVAFQDENGFVQIGNFTSNGWTLTQLGASLDPAIGTGLALQPFYRPGLRDQIDLFHQKSNSQMALASWKVGAVNNGGSFILNLYSHGHLPLFSWSFAEFHM